MTSRIIFFGTSEYALKPLEALVAAGYEISSVITAPDRPAGRGLVIKKPPVKIAAEKLGLKILQPESLKDPDIRKSLQGADLGIVAAYGKIIPQTIIDASPLGLINLHPSLLPKYRGPSPIQQTLLNGDKETGVTIIKIDSQIDHGPIIAREELSEKIVMMKYEELSEKLSCLSAELLLKILPDYLKGGIKLKPQDELQATYTKIITKEDGRIDWRDSAENIYNKYRALHVWPGIWTTWEGKTLKITDSRVNGGKFEIVRLQLEGRKEMLLKDFINGYG